MLTMVRLTFCEILNKRILLLGLVLTAIYLGIFGAGLYYIGKDMRLAPEIARLGSAAALLCAGLYVSGLMVSGLTIFSSVGAISSEIENGVMLATASKPLRRRDIFLGKLIGFGLVLVLYSLFVFLATNLLVRLLLGLKSGNLGMSLGLFCLQPLLLLAITMWGSSFFSTLGNGITMFMLYSTAVVGGMVEQIGGQMGSSSLTTIGVITSLLMPVDSMYRLANFVLLYESQVPTEVLTFNPFSTQTPASVWMVVYAIAYFLFFAWLGTRVFSRRDI